MTFFRPLLDFLAGRKPVPRDLRVVDYAEGDRLLRAGEGWRLAPEEDRNRQIGKVYLERSA